MEASGYSLSKGVFISRYYHIQLLEEQRQIMGYLLKIAKRAALNLRAVGCSV